MNKLKSLTWKYFLKQKKEEIGDWIDDSWEHIFVISLFVGVFLQVGWSGEKTYWIAIIGLCVLGIWVIIGIISLIIVIYDWINSNWKEAKERAKKELQK